MDYKEQIKLLIDKYKNEISKIDDFRSKWDDQYERGFYNGQEETFESVIKDLEKMVD